MRLISLSPRGGTMRRIVLPGYAGLCTMVGIHLWVYVRVSLPGYTVHPATLMTTVCTPSMPAKGYRR